MKLPSSLPSRQLLVFSIVVLATWWAPPSASGQGFQAGFDTTSYHPVYIKSSDDRFKLNIGVYAQFRYNANFRKDTPDSLDAATFGYNLARTRIFLEGDFTERFYYHIRANVNSSSNFELFVAYLQFNLKQGMWLRAGRQFMALGLEDWFYPQDLAAIEFSAQDFTYALWSNFGFQFRHAVSNHFGYWVAIGNGAYGGRRSFPEPAPTDATITARLEYNVFGSGNWGDAVSRKGREFGMLVGIGLGQTIRRTNKAEGLNGSRGGTQLNLDYSITGDGFHFFSHFTYTMLRFENDPDRNLPSFYTTFGYWLGENIFPYVRYDFVGKGNLEGGIENYSSPGVGIAYYPFSWSNRYKFSVEYNHLAATINNTLVEPDGQLGLVQSDFGAQQSIRMQLQFGF